MSDPNYPIIQLCFTEEKMDLIMKDKEYLKKLKRRYNSIGFVILIIGFIFLSMSLGLFVKENMYKKNGITITATVLTKKVLYGKSTQYVIYYRFITKEGITLEGSDDSNINIWRSLNAGSKLPVQYISSYPSFNRIAYHRNNEFGVIFLFLFGLIVIAAGVYVFITGQSIARDGILTEAMVTSSKTDNFLIFLKIGCIKYTYNDSNGKSYMGKKRMNYKFTANWRIGDRCKVCYDRKNPNNHLLVRHYLT
ncbi:MAG: hypothetical protein HQK91_06160 [Nitrospirae bacterium]|nr:hypothetical protein [Nitrospirota bacterium]MBF0541016.1 hypothetical protein [Nitrospirota bacterium]